VFRFIFVICCLSISGCGEYSVTKYDNGKVKQEGDLVRGELDGVWKKYYSNGQPSNVSEWDVGDKDGFYISYYRNGKIKEEGEYEDVFFFGRSYRVGEWKSYYENGQISNVSNYDDPIFWDGSYRDGMDIDYYPNGEVRSRVNWVDPWVFGRSEIESMKSFPNKKLEDDLKKYDVFRQKFWKNNFDDLSKIVISSLKDMGGDANKKVAWSILKDIINPLVSVKWGGSISRENLFLWISNADADADESFKAGFPTKREALRDIVSARPDNAYLQLNISKYFIQDQDFLKEVESILPYFKQKIDYGDLSQYSNFPKNKGGVYLQRYKNKIVYVGKTKKSMGFRKRMSDECNGNQNMKPFAARMLKKKCSDIITYIIPISDELIPDAEKRLIKFFGGPYTDGGELWNSQY